MYSIIKLLLIVGLVDSFVLGKDNSRSKRDSIGQNRLLNSRDRHFRALFGNARKSISAWSLIASFYLKTAENRNIEDLKKLVDRSY